MSAILNLTSLIFGLAAWILPLFNLVRQNESYRERWSILSIASFSACGISLCVQLFEINHRVQIEDWSALMDTSRAIAGAGILLLAGTIILNTVILLIGYGKTRRMD